MKIWKVWASVRCTENGKETIKHISKGFQAETRQIAVLKMKRELVDCDFANFQIKASKLVYEE